MRRSFLFRLRSSRSNHSGRRAALLRPRFESLENRYCLSGLSFGTPIVWNAGTSALAVTVGDFNGNGNADVGVAVYTGATAGANVLFGNGDGGFAAPRDFAIGEGTIDIASADFNGDGYDDLAVARQLSSNVTVLLGSANGEMSVSFSLGTTLPWSIAAEDFNEDGWMDLVFGTENMRRLNVLLGDGNGGFDAPATFPANGFRGVVDVGDFNADGHIDAIVTGGSSEGGVLDLLIGDGTGNFGNAPMIVFDADIDVLGIGDFNRDGNDDVALNCGTMVHVLLGDSTGGFAAPIAQPFNGALAGAVADFDGDGNDDLAIATSPGNEGVMSVFVGDGSGEFSPYIDFDLGLIRVSGFGSVAVGDFNLDGRPDLVVSGASEFPVGASFGRVSVLLNTTPHNQPPRIADQAMSLRENSADGTVVGMVMASDPDPGQTLSYAITAGNTGDAFRIDSSTGQIIVANNAARDFETTERFTLTIEVTDSGTPTLASVAIATVSLINVNEAPVNNAPTMPQEVAKNRSLAFSVANGNAIRLSDPDATTTMIQVTLTVRHGTLSLGKIRGLSFLVGDGNSDLTMTFRGTVAAVNAALDGLTYRPKSGFVGSDSLTITTNDLGSGLAAALVDTDVVSLVVKNAKQEK